MICYNCGYEVERWRFNLGNDLDAYFHDGKCFCPNCDEEMKVRNKRGA